MQLFLRVFTAKSSGAK